jgi:hypothetical protein
LGLGSEEEECQAFSFALAKAKFGFKSGRNLLFGDLLYGFLNIKEVGQTLDPLLVLDDPERHVLVGLLFHVLSLGWSFQIQLDVQLNCELFRVFFG